MKIDIEDLFIRYEIPNWVAIKKKVLEEIEEVGGFGVKFKDGSAVSETNYFHQEMFAYGNWTAGMIQKFLNHVHEKENILSHFQGHVWHQIYEKGDYHGWHVHGGVNYSSVVYIQLPEGECGTVFRIGDTEYQAPAKEGEILAFPACIQHRTLPNESDTNRIIMSLNWENNGPVVKPSEKA